jgi:hypothetical protein
MKASITPIYRKVSINNSANYENPRTVSFPSAEGPFALAPIATVDAAPLAFTAETAAVAAATVAVAVSADALAIIDDA